MEYKKNSLFETENRSSVPLNISETKDIFRKNLCPISFESNINNIQKVSKTQIIWILFQIFIFFCLKKAFQMKRKNLIEMPILKCNEL